MRYPANEKLEIIRIVEQSHLPVKRTLAKIGVSRPTFYRWAHAPQGFYPILNGGELAALYAFVTLYLAAAGGGSLSLDRTMRSDA
jgi:hypothetical protein